MKNGNEIKIFIVDDDKLFTSVLKSRINTSFAKEDLAISVFEAGEQCELFIDAQPDIAIVDFYMNSKYRDAMNGIRIIEMIKRKSPETHVILLTSEENTVLARHAFKHGALDYVVKNEHMFERVEVSLHHCLNLLEMKRDLIIQKKRGLFAMLVIAALLGIATTIQIFAPHLL